MQDIKYPVVTKQTINNDTTNIVKRQRRARNTFVLKTNVSHSGIRWLRMRETSSALPGRLRHKDLYKTRMHYGCKEDERESDAGQYGQRTRKKMQVNYFTVGS